MTCRVEDGKTYVQTYNAENRFESALLVETDCDTYTNTDIIARWDFSYDGDGSRVKQEYTEWAEGDITSTLTTYYFFGGAYEVQDDGANETIRKYYAFAGQTIAMRDGQGLKYFLTDHLGSVAAVTDEDGEVLEQQRYLPFGEVRSIEEDSEGTPLTIGETDFGYTSQRALDQQGNQFTLGLMDYKARFYSPYITHFTQPDSIIPDLKNPQAWNRYSYTLNNPVRYTDPSGHQVCDENGYCYDRWRGQYRAPTRFSYPKNNKAPQTLRAAPVRGFPPPVDNPVIGMGFDYEEPNGWGPNGEVTSLHNGVDLNPPDGATIVASGRGTVRTSDLCRLDNCANRWGEDDARSVYANKGYGNVVVVEYPYMNLPPDVQDLINPGESLYVLYGHLASLDVENGDRVNAGDVIGIEGNSGNSKGVHLHLEVRRGDSFSWSGPIVQNFSMWWNMPLINPHDIWEIGD